MAMVHLDDNNNGIVEDRNLSSGGSRWWDIDGPVPDSNDNSGINRNWFPQDFLFGTGTSAFQEDIAMMKQMGFNSYRFSISWPRILPVESVLPTELCRDDFLEFAEVCFWEFGDRVKHWTTLNEPWTCAVNGYVRGVCPPAYKVPIPGDKLSTKIVGVPPLDSKFIVADPSEAYTAAKNLLLAHAEAVDLYRSKFQERGNEYTGTKSGCVWFYSVPKGIYEMLLYMNDKYPELKEIYITENGLKQAINT
ncbi:hypothetical protein SASPL_124927 [Salvia splendens]|uniref:Beta-glucosidase n=1 Tax=Salvia splendens TaxID=180675 RepID=A0A8X8XGQ2_SALSN|nr:hypothetical protein SASPL_124927 [Salvia splendens]